MKASAFARDRAVCCYSGANLWVADHGATPTFPIDWCGHFTPTVAGGSRALENAITSCWQINHEMCDGERWPIWFSGGLPLKDAELTRKERADTLVHAERMQHIHASDWFLNRSLVNVLRGVLWACEPADERDARDDRYRARAALKFLKRWRSMARRQAVAGPERRGLASLDPSEDKRLLWRASQCANEAELLELMTALRPFMLASWSEGE